MKNINPKNKLVFNALANEYINLSSLFARAYINENVLKQPLGPGEPTLSDYASLLKHIEKRMAACLADDPENPAAE